MLTPCWRAVVIWHRRYLYQPSRFWWWSCRWVRRHHFVLSWRALSCRVSILFEPFVARSWPEQSELLDQLQLDSFGKLSQRLDYLSSASWRYHFASSNSGEACAPHSDSDHSKPSQCSRALAYRIPSEQACSNWFHFVPNPISSSSACNSAEISSCLQPRDSATIDYSACSDWFWLSINFGLAVAILSIKRVGYRYLPFVGCHTFVESSCRRGILWCQVVTYHSVANGRCCPNSRSMAPNYCSTSECITGSDSNASIDRCD